MIKTIPRNGYAMIFDILLLIIHINNSMKDLKIKQLKKAQVPKVEKINNQANKNHFTEASSDIPQQLNVIEDIFKTVKK
jgi:hypothetical protein